MGITGLNPFLKKYFRLPEREKYLSEFEGKRIAIDLHNYMYKQLYGAQKRSLATTDVAMFGNDRSETLKNWIGMVLNFLLDILEFGITPILIFDGVSVNEKSSTKQKRKDKNTDKTNRIKEIEKEIEKFDPVSVPQKLTEELKNLYSQVVYVSYEEQEYLRNILTTIGLPVVQAVSEAEKLCSMLTIEGICDATFSTDTDCYALGCPLLITKIDRKVFSEKTGKFDRKLTTVSLIDILAILKFSYSTFVDFCIMCGNDFNENIPKIGPKRAYDLLLEYKSIENLPKHLDIGILNHVRSREIFKVKPWKECYVSGSIDLPEGGLPDTARDVLESIGKESLLPRLVELIKNCPKAKDRGWALPPERKLLVIPRKVKQIEEKSKIEMN